MQDRVIWKEVVRKAKTIKQWSCSAWRRRGRRRKKQKKKEEEEEEGCDDDDDIKRQFEERRGCAAAYLVFGVRKNERLLALP